MSTLGSRIRECRKAKGLSLEDVADRFRIHKASVSDWERNETSPDIKRLPELASMLNTTTDYLLTGKKNAAWPFREVDRKRIEMLSESEILDVCVALNATLSMLEARTGQKLKNGTKDD
ncbi:helix-turn-helix domain-containing protein [Bordetella sp. FB-8]|uniref:helix-turn-helix domain-containing protein n=1 Tax=Bordetella sp. FB-8 TaxID=1159870 RepID=UPI0009D9DA33|nr:helix-turn-helix transcriptional regulator [Bordetella sp. FB-8]